MLEKVLEAPSPHLLDYIDRLTRQLPSNCEIFPWAELTAEEHRAIEAKIEVNPLYKKFSPFLKEDILEPLNSFGLRQDGRVIGWMVNHRIAPDTIRYSQLFVDPEVQPLSRGLLMLTKAICLHPDGQFGSFNFEPTNINMVKLVQRRLKPYLIEMRRSYVTTKELTQT